ncbi:putative G-protein coupled receptor 101 [Thelohanellus kitauei]|uniref:Putative G-protein coupled receptor 101 n=1 Tax=Thelohanellus kitauei TaxID=669202 RepID=A0A0C2MGA8_THEKT|nr:putative G-protein coupled receptor 101 [Thelohanellus kitauei]
MIIQHCYYDRNDFDSYVFSIVSFVFLGITAIISLLGTIYLIYLIKKYKKMRLSTNYLFLNLFISDTLNVLIPATLRFSGAFCYNYHFVDCQMIVSLNKIFGYVSILTLFYICMDRYIKLLYYFHYQRYYTVTRLKILLAITWIFSFIIGFTADINWGKLIYGPNDQLYSLCRYNDVLSPLYGTINEIVAIILPMFIIFIIYIVLYVKLQKKAKRRRLALYGTGQPSTDVSLNKSVDSMLLLSSVSVCIIYIICVVPICIIDIIVNSDSMINVVNEVYIPLHLVRVLVSMATIYPAIEISFFLIINRKYWQKFSTN